MIDLIDRINTFTPGAKRFLAGLFMQAQKGQINHATVPDAFYVPASALQAHIGNGYISDLDGILEVKDSFYRPGTQDYQGQTKAYRFTEAAQQVFTLMELKPFKPRKGQAYFEEKYSPEVLATLDEMLSDPANFEKPEHYLSALMLRAVIDEDGINRVSYRRAFYNPDDPEEERGRRFAAGPSLQNIPKVVREKLLSHVTDVDLANCHLQAMASIAESMNLECKALKHIANDSKSVRNEVAAFFNVTYQAAKILLIQTGYGAKPKVNRNRNNAFSLWIEEHNATVKYDDNGKAVIPAFLKQLVAEIAVMMKAIRTRKDAKWLRHNGYDASALAWFMQDMEDKILQVCERYCRENGIEIQALIFDGFIVTGEHHEWSALESEIHQFLRDQYGIDCHMKLTSKYYR